MKTILITAILLLIIGATGYRVTRIRLEPKVVAAYQRGRPRGIGRVTWADGQIRLGVQKVVDRHQRYLHNAAYVSDVNEIAR